MAQRRLVQACQGAWLRQTYRASTRWTTAPAGTVMRRGLSVAPAAATTGAHHPGQWRGAAASVCGSSPPTSQCIGQRRLFSTTLDAPVEASTTANIPLRIASSLGAVSAAIVAHSYFTMPSASPSSGGDTVVIDPASATSTNASPSSCNCQGKSAFVIGGTGAIGKPLIAQLLQNSNFETVTYIGRRSIQYDGPGKEKLKQQLIDFYKMDDYAAAFQGHDVGFCAMGTTRAKAGAEGFVLVDRTWVAQSAALAKAGGTKDFHLVSAITSDANSMFLYPQTKGLAEQDVQGLGFDTLHIYRPGFLEAAREEPRLVDDIMIRYVNPIVDLFRKEPFSVKVEDVALAIRLVACKASAAPGVHAVSHGDIIKLAKSDADA